MVFDRFLHHVVMTVKLVSNGCLDEVSPVGVGSLPNQEINMAEVDIAQVDRDLLAVRSFNWRFVHARRHAYYIYMDGKWMACVASSSLRIVFP